LVEKYGNIKYNYVGTKSIETSPWIWEYKDENVQKHMAIENKMLEKNMT